jgi:hypothetical protein
MDPESGYDLAGRAVFRVLIIFVFHRHRQSLGSSEYTVQSFARGSDALPATFSFGRDRVRIISADEIWWGSRLEYFRKSLCDAATSGNPTFGIEYNIGVLHLEEAKLVTRVAGTEQDLLHHDGDVASHKTGVK